MTNIENFIFGRFKDMPLAVRIITYLIFVLLYVYLVISPKFISGKIIFTTSEDEQYDYVDKDILYNIQDRQFKARTDEDGNWTIPVGKILPSKLKIKVYNSETKKYMKYDISLKDLWIDKCLDLNIQNGEIKEFMCYKNDNKNILQVFLSKINFGSKLFAEEFILPDKIKNEVKIYKTIPQLEKEILTIIKNSSNVDPQYLNTNLNIFDQSKISSMEEMIIYNKIKTSYSLSIPIEQWENLKKVEEIVKYIYNRLIFNSFLKEKDIKITTSFRDQLEMVPDNIKQDYRINNLQ